jgi:hypothetical protein
MGRERQLPWHGAPIRRALGLSLWLERVGIGLHPAVFVENRGDGVSLYTRSGISSGTPLAVIPSTSLLLSSTLQAKSVPSAFPLQRTSEAVVAAEVGSTVSALLMCADWRVWAQLAWRLAMELCNRTSRWWGWAGQLPPVRDLAASFEGQACRSAWTGAPSAIYPYWRRLASEIQREADAAWDALQHHPAALIVPRTLFRHAVRLLLRRATWLPKPGDGFEDSDPELGIIPIIDCAWPRVHCDGGAPNAMVEIARAEELPKWHTDGESAESPFADAVAPGDTGAGGGVGAEDNRVRRQQLRIALADYFIVLTANEDVAPAARLSIDVTLPPTTAPRDAILAEYARTGYVGR